MNNNFQHSFLVPWGGWLEWWSRWWDTWRSSRQTGGERSRSPWSWAAAAPWAQTQASFLSRTRALSRIFPVQSLTKYENWIFSKPIVNFLNWTFLKTIDYSLYEYIVNKVLACVPFCEVFGPRLGFFFKFYWGTLLPCTQGRGSREVWRTVVPVEPYKQKTSNEYQVLREAISSQQ